MILFFHFNLYFNVYLLETQEKTENDILQKSHGKFLSPIGIRSPADCYDHELQCGMPYGIKCRAIGALGTMLRHSLTDTGLLARPQLPTFQLTSGPQ